VCISQEYPDVADSQREKSNEGMEARLSRVEELLERLVEITNISPSEYTPDATQIHVENSYPGGSHTPGIPTPTSTSNPPTPPLPSKYNNLSHTLLSVWPTKHDLDLICYLPIGLSTHLHMKLCCSSASLMTQCPNSPVEMLQLPPPSSHPVLFARKLLILGSLLQGAISASQVPVDQRPHFKEIMERVVDTADRVVLRDDELVVSVEGVECIMILAMIQNYAGELHRAWMSTRRAAGVAQMIGLHRATSLKKTGSLKVLDPATRAGLDPQQLCYRIVEMDRYLSITLGLPQSSLESSALEDKACHPLDRMARLQVIVAGRILSKSHTPRTQEETEEIYRLLQEAETLMPSQWWLIPNYSTSPAVPPDPIHEVARTMYQISHYHLVIRVHLPYMLSKTTDGHSKATAIHASREILARYIAFRTWNPGHYYCRGLDYLSFIALTVLCLAHIDSRNSTPGSGTSLAHSRPSDRATMERTVQILQNMEDDATAEKLSRIMTHLLDVEAASASGVEYSAESTENEDDGTMECGADFVDSEKDRLQLHIPYFGTINLQRKSIAGIPPAEQGEGYTAVGDLASYQAQQMFPEWDNQWSLPGSSADIGELDDWTLQSINQGLFSGLFDDVEVQDATRGVRAKIYCC
jgi:hypothetical protein